MEDVEFKGLTGPEHLWSLLDWRRCIAELYAGVRACASPEEAWRLWRDGRDRLFAGHPQSPWPRSGDAGGVRLFPYNPAYRFLVEVEAAQEDEVLHLDLGDDGVNRHRLVGRTRGLADVLGGELPLFWMLGYGGGLFLPFRDATSGGETYGGGRYLLDTRKGADLGMREGRLVLDFNFAYNPSCAYSARWVCPLPSKENTLPFPLQAGEKAPYRSP